MNKKKFLSLLLAVTTTMSLVACGGGSAEPEETTNASTESTATTESAATTESTAETTAEAETTEEVVEIPDLKAMTYDEASAWIYDYALGDFYEAYEKAFEASSVSEKYALMAIAEAKLMESAVMFPTNTQGGNYAFSRVVPYTVDYSLWGNDYERYHNALVCNEFLTSAERDYLRSLWAEKRGTGTYFEEAKAYLEGQGHTFKDTYTLEYPSDPATWDVLATSRSADAEAIINTYDGLMEYDCEGFLQPALAESYEVSADGLTYTFHLREGVKWVDSQGREVAEVTADDFVAGMQHMMDAMGGLEYLIENIIVNASSYIYDEITDFSQVGVKAVDDYTLEYHLNEPCSYFTTMLGYGVFAPMNRAFYEAHGGKFGEEFDSSAADYTYGTTPDNIAYCGPYLVTNATANNTIVFKANESYYAPELVNVKTLTWLYNDGTDVTKSYYDALAGTIDGAGLTTNTIEIARNEEVDGNNLFDTYVYVSSTLSTSYMGFYNLNRAVYANVADDTTAVSTMTDEDKVRTDAAILNVHFRRALSFGLDRATYNAQRKGEDLKLNSLRNCYTPGNFVSLEEDVTVDINGTATTFKAATFYGEIMQAQLDADGFPIKVWDATTLSSDGFDGWYNVDNAKAELAKAVEELAAQGVEVSAENPIYIDLPYPSNSEPFTNQANAYKQSIESSLGGAVIVNLVACTDYNEWYYAGYYTDYGYEANYTLYDLSGWGPDYGDPSTYLDTFLPEYAGYMIKCIGLY